eukprot:m.28221 g.28221  ORF g.28221 m.28221 type:complete len:713 (+) comp15887_c0_seq1:191-2329(+)
MDKEKQKAEKLALKQKKKDEVEKLKKQKAAEKLQKKMDKKKRKSHEPEPVEPQVIDIATLDAPAEESPPPSPKQEPVATPKQSPKKTEEPQLPPTPVQVKPPTPTPAPAPAPVETQPKPKPVQIPQEPSQNPSSPPSPTKSPEKEPTPTPTPATLPAPSPVKEEKKEEESDADSPLPSAEILKERATTVSVSLNSPVDGEVEAPIEGYKEAITVKREPKKGIARKNSARRSLHGAATPVTAGVKSVASPLNSKRVSTTPEEETGLGQEVVQDECDDTVGQMESTDVQKTATYLSNAIEQFKQQIVKLHAGGTNRGYSSAYNAMQPIGRGQAADHSQREPNKLKNRYGNIMAYDHSRVELPVINDDPDTTYINANWIRGWSKERAYIASQGPVPNSFISFWRMIWSQKVETICMVTHEVEQGRMKCHRYWPDPTSSPPSQTIQYGQIYVTHLESIPHKHFVVRRFEVSFEDEKRIITQFAYTSWPDHGVPLTTQEMLGFRNAIKSSIRDTSLPQVIHCSAGVGRTGTYIAIDRIMQQCMDMGPNLDVDAIVKDMRMARNFMVQTEVQYMFIFRAVLDGITELLTGESSKAEKLEMEKMEMEALKKQAEKARKEEEERKEEEQKAIESARIDVLAREGNSAQAAQQVVGAGLSIKERLKLLAKSEERWLESYKASLAEWSERNQHEAETYDLTSALTPIQSRIEALRQKGVFDT